jgi:hypothetical protein
MIQYVGQSIKKYVVGRVAMGDGGKRTGERGRETVIGEECSRKGKRGGGEALEAPGSTWCTRYHYITLAYSPPTSPSLSLSLFSCPCLSACCLLLIYSRLLFLFPLRFECKEGRRRRKRERKRKEEGTTPHDRSAKLKARHKPFYTPTRSTVNSPPPYQFLPRPLSVLLLSPPSSLSLSSPLFLSLPTPRG